MVRNDGTGQQPVRQGRGLFCRGQLYGFRYLEKECTRNLQILSRGLRRNTGEVAGTDYGRVPASLSVVFGHQFSIAKCQITDREYDFRRIRLATVAHLSSRINGSEERRN